MKSLIVLALSLLSLSAFAADHGIHGPILPVPGPYVLAEVMNHPGFIGPPYNRVTGTRIYSDGRVMSVLNEQETLELTLSESRLAAITDKVRLIASGELLDLQKGQPMCADAPSTEYSAQKGPTAPTFRIAARQNCHEYQLKNGEGQDIKSLLDALTDVSR